MKPTIAALFGVIAMACIRLLKHETTRRRTVPSFCPGRCQKFKERNQVKNEVALNVQEISSGLPFVIDDQEISSLMKISTS
jgi:hypothetical protein